MRWISALRRQEIIFTHLSWRRGIFNFFFLFNRLFIDRIYFIIILFNGLLFGNRWRFYWFFNHFDLFDRCLNDRGLISSDPIIIIYLVLLWFSYIFFILWLIFSQYIQKFIHSDLVIILFLLL